MASDDEQDDGGAAQAFAELRAEVTVMRRAMEGLPAVIKGLASPDYSPSFGAVGKALANVDARLAGIEGHPALKMTPAQHGDAIERAGATIYLKCCRLPEFGPQQLWRVKEEVQSLAVTARSAGGAKKGVAMGDWRWSRRWVGFVSDAWGLRARRQLSGGLGDGERRSVRSWGDSHSGGKPGTSGGAGGGVAAGERER